MAFAVRLFKRVAFPTELPTGSGRQIRLEPYDEEAITEIWSLGPSEHNAYDKFQVKHEYTVNMEGRVGGQYFTQFTRTTTFPCFSHRERPWILSSHAKIDVAARAFKRLTEKRSVSGTVIQPATLFLPLAYERLQSARQIKGGWFGKLQIAKVEAAYLYGDDVADSDDWNRYMGAGELRALHIEIPYEDRDMSVMLTREASVVFYSDLTERDYLEYATTIFEEMGEFITFAEDRWL